MSVCVRAAVSQGTDRPLHHGVCGASAGAGLSAVAIADAEAASPGWGVEAPCVRAPPRQELLGQRP